MAEKPAGLIYGVDDVPPWSVLCLLAVQHIFLMASTLVLPIVLVFMLLLTNDRELMGEHANTPGFNAIAWITVGVMIALTIAMVLTQL